VPLPDTGALQQVANLAKAGDVADAFLIGKMEVFPRAVWLTGGTPEQVAATTAETIRQAHGQLAVPVFVVYNIPGRDCGSYSVRKRPRPTSLGLMQLLESSAITRW